jgi:hypothetical protein
MKKGKAAKKQAAPKRVVRKRVPTRRVTRTVLVADPAAPATDRILVELPADGTLKDQAEAEQFVRTLYETGQLARSPGPLPPGATHWLEPDPSGACRLVRRRYSAI